MIVILLCEYALELGGFLNEPLGNGAVLFKHDLLPIPSHSFRGKRHYGTRMTGSVHVGQRTIVTVVFDNLVDWHRPSSGKTRGTIQMDGLLSLLNAAEPCWFNNNL